MTTPETRTRIYTVKMNTGDEHLIEARSQAHARNFALTRLNVTARIATTADVVRLMSRGVVPVVAPNGVPQGELDIDADTHEEAV